MARSVELFIERVRGALRGRVAEAPPQPEVRELVLAENNGHIPRSRRLLAVPFVGKDRPSRASEFSHPDVLIGLSILAYRYEGLRRVDFERVLRQLRQGSPYRPWLKLSPQSSPGDLQIQLQRPCDTRQMLSQSEAAE